MTSDKRSLQELSTPMSSEGHLETWFSSNQEQKDILPHEMNRIVIDASKVLKFSCVSTLTRLRI